MASEVVRRFEQLRERTYGRTFYYLLSLVKNHDDAEDLAQETYIRAYRVCENLDEQTSFTPHTWLKRIAFTAFLDYLRKKGRRIKTEPMANSEGLEWDPADPSPNPEDEVLSSTFDGPLEDALNELTDDDRRLVLASLIGEQSHAGLSQAHGCGVSQIRTRLHNAHRLLRLRMMSVGSFKDAHHA